MILQNTKKFQQHSVYLLFRRPICSHIIKNNYSTDNQPVKSPRRVSRFLFKSTALFGIGTAIFGGLVWYDERVKKVVEENVPYSKEVFDVVFGMIEEKSKKVNVDQLANFFGKDSSPIEQLKDTTDNEGEKFKLTTISDLTPESSTKSFSATKTSGEIADKIKPVEVNKHIKVELEKEKPQNTILDNEFEMHIIESLKIATERASTAKDSKMKTLDAIQKHSTLLKEVIDRGFTKEANADEWKKVENAASHIEECSKQDSIDEDLARKAIDSLKTQINEGRVDPKKSSSPALANSIETVKKLSLRLDELNFLLVKKRSQKNMFNYKEMLKKHQHKNEEQNSSMFSNISLNEKGVGGLAEQELNAHIIFANEKIDELKKQIEETQLKEGQTISDALEKQRIMDEKLAKLHVEIELQRAKENESQLIDEKKQEFRKEWEAEVNDRLKLASLAHAEHLEKVIRTQKQLHDIENAQIVEEAVTIERNKFAKQIQLALDRLNGIENVLNSRTAQDLENRRTKIFWTICQNLFDSLIGSQKSQHSTHLNEIKLLKNFGEHDGFVQSICNCFPQELSEGLTTIQTEEGLKNRFEKVHKLARRTAQIGDSGGSPLNYFLSWLQSLFVLQIASAKYSIEDKIDIDKYEPYELLNRIKYFVKIGDLKNAVRLANLLRGESARIFQDWIRDTQIHLEARFLTELLLSHAQVTSIRTTY